MQYEQELRQLEQLVYTEGYETPQRHIEKLWDEVKSLRMICESLRSYCERLDNEMDEKVDK